jgi:hypothetical protein
MRDAPVPVPWVAGEEVDVDRYRAACDRVIARAGKRS